MLMLITSRALEIYVRDAVVAERAACEKIAYEYRLSRTCRESRIAAQNIEEEIRRRGERV